MPSSTSPGYTSFRGRTCCVCLAEWLPWFERMLVKKGVIGVSLDIAQLTGGAAASGGTHSQGGAFDVWQRSPQAISIARSMGSWSWARSVAQGFDPHHHGVLNGCPHNWPAYYQIVAGRAGFNGLGYLGRSGRDDGPFKVTRTWREGIAWAQAQLDEFKPGTGTAGTGAGGAGGTPTPPPPVKEDDMPKQTPWRSNPDDQPIPARKWTMVRLGKSPQPVSLINEAQDALVAQTDISLICTGLTSASVVQVRTFITDAKGKRISSSYGQEFRGVSRMHLSTGENLGAANRRVYVELWSTTACKVTQVGARALYWN